jgi:integrase
MAYRSNCGHGVDMKPSIIFTDKIVRELPVPKSGYDITYDGKVKQFGVRVTSAGARSYILRYRTRAGRERTFTLGQTKEWATATARKEAAEIKRKIRFDGYDPLEAIDSARAAPSMGDLCDRFDKEHVSKKRQSTASDYQHLIRRFIRPGLKTLKVAEVSYTDIDRLHRKITDSNGPYIANRTIAVLSVMFKLAIRWKMRTDNPVSGIERNPEQRRQTYLTKPQLSRLAAALDGLEDKQAADIFRLLLLTGARRGEVLGARWEDLDLEARVWVKPGATTKQKTEHRAPLSSAAVLLLKQLQDGRKESPWVFPGIGEQGHRDNVKRAWATIRKEADTTARIHDLRHTYASVLASAGQSLSIIGALLGHTQATTTARYTHLFDDPLRHATESVAAIVTGKPSAEVVKFREAKE